MDTFKWIENQLDWRKKSVRDKQRGSDTDAREHSIFIILSYKENYNARIEWKPWK